MSDRDLSQRLEVARRIAQEAGRLVMRYYGDSIAVQRKADDSPVTQADREAELLLRREIEAVFPEDAIVGEEHGNKEGTSAYRWIVDPIDGTKSFIAGVPLFGTLVGVQRDDEPVVGVIELPALGLRVHAAKGQGAWWQAADGPPQAARVSAESDLAQSLYLTSDARTFADRGASAVHEQLEKSAWYTRTWGDCYGYFLVATGRAAVMVDPIMNVWDAAAVYPVLVEAGGTFTDWLGQPRIDGGEGIGSNGAVLAQVLQVTRPFAGESRG